MVLHLQVAIPLFGSFYQFPPHRFPISSRPKNIGPLGHIYRQSGWALEREHGVGFGKCPFGIYAVRELLVGISFLRQQAFQEFLVQIYCGLWGCNEGTVSYISEKKSQQENQ